MRKSSDTVKVSMNIDRKLLTAIDDYCCKVGITRTCAFSLFLFRGACFEQEVLQVLGNNKKLKRLNSICNEEFLAGIEASLMKAGNMISNASYSEIYELSGLNWYADSIKYGVKNICKKIEEFEDKCKKSK